MSRSSFQRGLRAWQHALASVQAEKSLRLFVLLPLAVNGVLLAVLFYGMFTKVQPLLLSWVLEPGAAGVWAFVLTALSYLTALLLWALLVVPVYAVSNLLLAPAHSVAAEKVLRRRGVSFAAPEGAGAWTAFFVRSLFIGLAKAVILIGVGVPLFLGGFLPGVGFVFVYLSFVVLAFDCTDYSLEVLGLGLRERFSYLKAHRAEYLGFSLVFFAVSFVPLAMIFALPLGIVAGAHLVAEIDRARVK